ncbi:hypothetical protein D3Y55_32420 (plasmid) [Mesorhizobium sp. DCY119]|nr:hypothetical protein D3Y55_32420 [Mesorhizobium sp. DCY119]
MGFPFAYSPAFPNRSAAVQDDGATEPQSVVEFADVMTVLSTRRQERAGIRGLVRVGEVLRCV